MANNITKIILCGDLGPKYTDPNTNIAVIEQKAVCFESTWSHIKNGATPTLKPNPRIMDAVWESYTKDFMAPTENNKKKQNILKAVEARGVDLLLSTEEVFREGLEQLIDDGIRQIKRPTYMKGLISNLRQALMAIGREHAYGNGEVRTNMGFPLIHTGNPMTKSTQTYMVEKIKGLNTSTSERSQVREGAPASLPFVHFMHIMLLWEAIQQVKDINDTKRIINNLELSLLLNLLTHEVSRPGDCFREMLHSHLYLPLHEPVYMLAFAFLKPQSLAYFWENNHLTKYVCSFYKGKHKKQFLDRVKSVIPTTQNALDLMFSYTIITRLMLMVDPSHLTSYVVSARRLIARLKAFCDQQAISFFTFYSIRYAHAEEMVKGNLPVEVIRRIMGHTDSSDMNKQYANNKEKRVTVADQEVPLGMDLYDVMTDNSTVPIEFNQVSGAIMTHPDFLDKIKDLAVRDEFVEVVRLTKQWIDHNDTSAALLLLQRIAPPPPSSNAKHRVRHAKYTAILDYLKHIPYGTHFIFPDRAFPETVLHRFTETREQLTTLFKQVPRPTTNIPYIWSFPQVVFGNWNPSGQQSTPVLMPTPTPTPTLKPPKHLHNPPPPLPEWDIIPENIEKGDMVVILCPRNKIDKFSMKLPTVEDRMVWLATAISYSFKTKMFKGKFMYNEDKDIAKPWKQATSPESVKITDMDIMEIFTPDNPKVSWVWSDFTVDNIKSIEDNVKLVMRLAASHTKKRKLG